LRSEGRVTQYTPLKTNTVPAMIHALNGSSKIHTPMSSVNMGPIMPVCDVKPGPMRSMAIMTKSTGNTVQRVALSKDNQSTGSGTEAEANGLSSTNCNKQKPQATEVAKPTKRNEPKRCTSCPLYVR
jgi:hypothetical protein